MLSLSRKSLKRFCVDWWGNYVFFVPIVGILNGIFSGWTWGIFIGYALTSIFMAAVSGRLFTFFLAKFWYPLFGEKF